MMTIFKYFFGIIGIIILIYVLIVVGKAFLSATVGILSQNSNATTTNSTSTTSTGSSAIVQSLAGFSLLDWLKGFHPFQYAPVNVGVEGTNSKPTYSYAQSIVDGLSGSSEDFDRRWGGSHYFSSNANGDVTDPSRQEEKEKINTSNYIHIDLENEIILLKNDQVIKGKAYYKLYTDKVFPIYILDENKKSIGVVKAFVNGNIDRNGYVPFRAVITYLPSKTTTGYLVFVKPEHKVMKVSFADRATSILSKMPNMIYPTSDIQNELNNRCVIAGCRMQLCVEQREVKQAVADCQFRPIYACYQKAICERNRETGRCGWRVNNTLARCLQDNSY